MRDAVRVLGLDPGLNVTGYGMISATGPAVELVEGGVVRTTTKDPLERRLATLFTGLGEVLDELRPEYVAVEELFTHYQRPRTAIVMGHARGVLLLAAAMRELPVVGYAPSRVKKALTGSGAATKAQVQEAIARAFGLSEPPRPSDVADALAVALCHANVLSRGGAVG